MYRKGTTDARVLDAAVQVVRVVRILRMGSAMGNRIRRIRESAWVRVPVRVLGSEKDVVGPGGDRVRGVGSAAWRGVPRTPVCH